MFAENHNLFICVNCRVEILQETSFTNLYYRNRDNFNLIHNCMLRILPVRTKLFDSTILSMMNWLKTAYLLSEEDEDQAQCSRFYGATSTDSLP